MVCLVNVFIPGGESAYERGGDKTGHDNVLFRVLYSPMYIDFIQIITHTHIVH